MGGSSGESVPADYGRAGQETGLDIRIPELALGSRFVETVAAGRIAAYANRVKAAVWLSRKPADWTGNSVCFSNRSASANVKKSGLPFGVGKPEIFFRIVVS